MSDMTSKIINELKQAIAEKDREIEAKETELGKLDAELIVLRGDYQQLMEKAVDWASYIMTIDDETWETYKDAKRFLASPEVQAWKEHQS